MKKFDLEAAKNGAPVCTRDGRPVRIICWDRKDNAYPIIALIGECEDELEDFTEDGCFYKSRGESNYDLFMAPTQHTTHVILYRKKNGEIGIDPFTFDTIEEAEKEASTIADVITIGEITWEE